MSIGNYDKYRLVLGGELAAHFSPDLIKRLIELWVEENGAKNVSSGVIRADLDQAAGVMIYSAHFDSSHWTGVGFKGFDVKNPGELQTL
jgi:hypothetical protein